MIYVMTLNWNGLDKLKKLKDGLIRNLNNIKLDYDACWCIRDNGSKDGSIEWINEIKKSGNVATLPLFVDHNRDNFAKGVNSLVNMVMNESDLQNSKDYILLLNNDVVFNDDHSLLKMYNLMENTGASVVGSRLLYNNSNKLQHAGIIFGKRYNYLPYHFRHKEISDKYSEQNRYFQAVTAACCLIKASDFKYLDERFHWSFDDVDMCFQIGQDGKKIAYCGETNISHEESASLKKNPVNKMFMQHNVKLFREKWSGKYDIDHEKYLSDPNYMLV